METAHKKVLKSISLDLRHLLEGAYDAAGRWCPGDLEQRLAAIGVRRDREPVAVDELPHLSPADCKARQIVDAYLELRADAGVGRAEAVAEFVRETAYTWANRLIALRCMEARDLIDEVILQKAAYGGRSLEHHRLAQRQPGLCAGEDDGLLAVLDKVFAEQADRQPMLFDPAAPGVTLKPSAAAIKRCLALLSDSQKVGDQVVATSDVFKAPDALGWAYQYWNTEEKDRVFEKVRTQKGAKIEGADIIPATQLYTEPYMVKFLVQNSLGAIWMGMYPESRLCEKWEYYVRNTERASVEKKPVAEITFLDPAGGSGHFLLEGFDLFYDMYMEEGRITDPEAICRSILENNLFSVDIDARAVQIAEVALWMKAAERAFGFEGKPTNLVAAVASHLKGPLWEKFLAGFESEPSVARVLRKFGQAMEHIDELGSLARPDEDLRAIIHEEHATWEQQVTQKKEANFLFSDMAEDKLSGQLPFHEVSDEEFGERMLYRAKAAIHTFTQDAHAAGNVQNEYLASEAAVGFKLFDVLGRKYDVVAANPPYMGTTQLSPTVSAVVARHANSPDLYCALMLRWLDLQVPNGIAALVTRADYLTQAECEELRSQLLARTSIQILVRLENRVFRDLSNPNAIFFSMQVHSVPRVSSPRLVHISVDSGEFEGKASELANRISLNQTALVAQQAFENLPRHSFALNLPEWGYIAYTSHPMFHQFAAARQGLITGDTSRFLRFRWEILKCSTKRWKLYAKGGEFCRWFGNDCWAVDWGHDGSRLRHFVDRSTGKSRSRVQNTAYYGREGLTWSSQTVSAFATRILEPGSIFDTTGSSAFLLAQSDTEANRLKLMGVLNSPCFGVLFRSVQPGVHFGEGYLENLPCPHPASLPEALAEAVSRCIYHQMEVASFDICSSRFRPQEGCGSSGVRDAAAKLILSKLDQEAEVYAAELAVWDLGEEALGVPRDSRTTHIRANLITGFDDSAFLERLWRSTSSPTAELQLATQSGFEDACVRTGARPEAGRSILDTVTPGTIPADTLQDAATALLDPPILSSLGYHWPNERVLARSKPVTDGIIPVTHDTDEPAVLDRLRERFGENDGSDAVAPIEREFAELLGKSVDQWLELDFFAHHVSQFKRRPIAWQIQSGKFSARTKPAFACLVYYHKLDGDLLEKLRTQYVGPLRQRWETELRGIESVAPSARSERQTTRRSELGDLIKELQDFDACLRTVQESGFETPLLRQFAVEDALLCMKARWLRRLSETIQAGPLAGWKTEARTDVHDDLPGWIDEAMAHLDYHCSRVTPEEWGSADDPMPPSLAARICENPASLVASALGHANAVWSGRLNEEVLAPLRREMSEKKESLKEIQARLKELTDRDRELKADLKDEEQRLKREIKKLKEKIDGITAGADRLRKKIVAWQCREAAGWEPWLAAQPMYDAISSVDGRRRPPTTVPEWITQERSYVPDINDGVRVNIAPVQKAGLLAADVLATRDLDKAIADRAEWRTDERRWCREGKLPQPGWWQQGSE